MVPCGRLCSVRPDVTPEQRPARGLQRCSTRCAAMCKHHVKLSLTEGDSETEGAAAAEWHFTFEIIVWVVPLLCTDTGHEAL